LKSNTALDQNGHHDAAQALSKNRYNSVEDLDAHADVAMDSGLLSGVKIVKSLFQIKKHNDRANNNTIRCSSSS
jgi:hypothetical protein